MPIYDRLLAVQQQEQVIADEKGMNELRKFEIGQAMRQNRLDDEARAAVRAAELVRIQSDRRSAQDGGIQTTSNMPREIQVLSGQVNSLMSTAQSFRDAATQVRSTTGDAKTADEFDKRAEAATTEAMRGTGQLLLWQKDNYNRVASAAGAYNPKGSNGENMQALATLDKLMPDWSLNADVDKDITGRVVPGPHTARAMNVLSKSAETVRDQREDEYRQWQIKNGNATQERMNENLARQERRDDVLETDARERIKLIQTKEDRIRAAQEAKDKKVKALKDAAREPTSKDVVMLAGKLSNDLKLPKEDADAMARDVLVRQSEILGESGVDENGRPNVSLIEARKQALEEVMDSPDYKKEHDVEEPGKYYGTNTKKVPASYRALSDEGRMAQAKAKDSAKPSNAQDRDAPKPVLDAMTQVGPKLTKAGVGIRWNEGKLIVDAADAKGKNRKFAQEAQDAIDKKANPVEVLKRLGELIS